MVMIGFEVSKEGRKPGPAKVTALAEWPEEAELADVNSLFHFANYLQEFIPNFTDIVQPLKQYRAKGAKWEDYKKDPEAIAASKALPVGPTIRKYTSTRPKSDDIVFRHESEPYRHDQLLT